MKEHEESSPTKRPQRTENGAEKIKGRKKTDVAVVAECHHPNATFLPPV